MLITREHIGMFFIGTYGEMHIEGIIHEQDGRIFVCQNVINGASCRDKHGYRYSYHLGIITRGPLNSDYTAIHNMNIVDKDCHLRMSPSFRTFMSNMREKSVICSMIINNQHITCEQVNYLSNREKVISFMPAGKEQLLNDNGSWKTKGRQLGKPAKVARKLFTAEGLAQLTDKDFEIFANLYKASNDVDGDFSIVKGEDIRKWYDDDRYAPNTGSLTSSCMRYKRCQRYFDIYCNNKQVSLLILTKDNQLLGRALLWDTNEGKVMDRVYASDSTIVRFNEWAEDNDYIRRDGNSYFTKDGQSQYMAITITLDEGDFDYYPYMDTFYYLNGNTLSNEDPKGYDYDTLQEQNGGPRNDDNEYQQCVDCDEEFDTEDMLEIRSYLYCRECACYCNHLERNIRMRDSFVCAWSDERYHEDYSVETIEGETVYQDHTNLIYVDDGYTHRDHTFKCEYDDELHHVDDQVEWVDGEGNTYYLYESNLDAFIEEHTFECAQDGRRYHTSTSRTITKDGVDYLVHMDNVELFKLKEEYHEIG